MAYLPIKDKRLLLLPVVLLVTLIYIGVWREEKELASGGRLLREELASSGWQLKEEVELASSGGLLGEEGEVASSGGLRKGEGELVSKDGHRRKEGKLASSGGLRRKEGKLVRSGKVQREEGELASSGGLLRKEGELVSKIGLQEIEGKMASSIGLRRKEAVLVSSGEVRREGELASSGGLQGKEEELMSRVGIQGKEDKLASSGGLRRKEEELMSSGDLRREEGELTIRGEPRREEGQLVSGGEICQCEPQPAEPLWNRTLDFEALKFSNETGNPSGEYLVPNFVHFIHFGGKPLSYVHLICTLAAYKNQKPKRLYLHYNDHATFTGKYWEVLYNTSGVKDVLLLNKIEVPSEIFGQKLNDDWRNYHGSDIMRIRIIMQYGGIYFDNDVYLVHSLDDFRRFELAIPWEYGKMLGNQVIVAHRDARFLRRWLDGYRKYDKTKWYYNAGDKPTIEVLYQEPHLVHRVLSEIATDFNIMSPLFRKRMVESKLRQYYAFHLLTRWLHLTGNYSSNVPYPKEFNETNVVDYPVTFRDLAFAVYDTAGVDWPKNSSTGG